MPADASCIDSIAPRHGRARLPNIPPAYNGEMTETNRHAQWFPTMSKTGTTAPRCTWLATTATTSAFSRIRQPLALNWPKISNDSAISPAKMSSTCNATSERTRSGLRAAEPSRVIGLEPVRGLRLPTRTASPNAQALTWSSFTQTCTTRVKQCPATSIWCTLDRCPMLAAQYRPVGASHRFPTQAGRHLLHPR